MATANFDLESIGGGGFGGFGGGNFANNPLAWLVILAFLRGDNGLLGGGGGNAAAGFVAGENRSTLDCLAQGQAALRDQIADQTNALRFSELNSGISELAGISRDNQAALMAKLAECCCETQTGLVAIQNAISQQTATLTLENSRNTQSILDAIRDNQYSNLQAENVKLSQDAQTAQLIAALAK